jgi:hypothetical protein
MAGIVETPEERRRRKAALTAVVWYAVPAAALVLNAFVVPREDTSCDDASGWCFTARDAAGILVMVSAPFLIVSLVVAVLVAGRLGRTFTSPIAAGTLAALAGLSITAAGALVLYWGHAVELY